jgi:hypothetical protein
VGGLVGGDRSTFADQAPVPGQQRRWSDDSMQMQVAGEQTSQSGQDCSIRPAGSRSADLTAKHGDFVAQDEDLEVFGCGVAGEQSQPAEHCDRDQIQQSEQHDPRSCHEHSESTKPQVTTLMLGFGTLHAAPTASTPCVTLPNSRPTSRSAWRTDPRIFPGGMMWMTSSAPTGFSNSDIGVQLMRRA